MNFQIFYFRKPVISRVDGKFIGGPPFSMRVECSILGFSIYEGRVSFNLDVRGQRFWGIPFAEFQQPELPFKITETCCWEEGDETEVVFAVNRPARSLVRSKLSNHRKTRLLYSLRLNTFSRNTRFRVQLVVSFGTKHQKQL